MKTSQILLVSFLIYSMVSCGTHGKFAKLDPTTKYFDAKKRKVVDDLIKLKVNPDTLKTLLVVANSKYGLEMGKNLEYFDEVMTLQQLEAAIIKNRLTDKIPLDSNKLSLPLVYKHFKPFVLLSSHQERKKNGKLYSGLYLYHPGKNEVIFKNEIWVNLMWDGWTDQGTYFPLYNSLLKYLREN